MLAIEIDGSSHDNEDTVKYDQKRQKRLEKFGVRFLRFDDLDVKRQIESILKSIEDCIEKLSLG
ncbi:hypothetical protein MATR_01500 [Marivirga tractuosa]|nr:hypothetical protein MATR_01500 [Marivirga tractuosa]